MLLWRRTYASARMQQAKSHLKAKLDHFTETGEIHKLTPFQAQRKAQRKQENVKRLASKARPSASKALLLLKAKYDSTLLATKSGQKIDLQTTKPLDLYVDLKQLVHIFHSLMEVKKLTRKPIDEKILLTLLGLSPEQLKDPYLVTKDVLKLLERDNDTARAMQLCLMAKQNAEVGMNAILQWCLEHGDVEEATRTLNRRKKWGIPANEHTYIHYYSGISKCHEWGLVPDELAAKCVEMFSRMEVKPTVEIFNACLSVLVKNYSAHQTRAWEFFNELESFSIRPTSQTFTIFLNGCKKLHQSQCQKIRLDNSINSSQRASQLFRAQAGLVTTANMVLEKLKTAATPPVPPTRQEVDADPGLLEIYRKNAQRTLMDIDPVFASTFVLCYINNHAGTSFTASQGSHYAYLQQGLQYLQMWCPEVESMLYFVQKLVSESKLNESTDGKVNESKLNELGNLGSLELVYFGSAVSSEVQKRTDARMEYAQLNHTETPQSKCRPLQKSEVNPLVIFPPPAFSSRKTKAIFSGKQKRLVDFGRPTFADIDRLVAHRNFVNSKGKYGKKLPALKSLSMDRKPAINKFLLQLALDALVKLGLHKEFYLAMWYALTKWGGLYVSRTELVEAERAKLTCGALPLSAYPQLKRIPVGDGGSDTKNDAASEVSMAEKIRLTPSHDASIIDSLLVENFIYKIEENFHHADVPVRFASELVAALVSDSSNLSKTLLPRDKTFDYIFSILNRDIHLYNDKNLHQGAVANRKKSLPNNTPKKSLTAQQLRDVLDPLTVLMQSIMVHEEKMYAHSKNRKSLMLNRFVESYNSLINTIYAATWTDAPENHENAAELHKKIVHSGILLYRPRSLVDPREKLVFAHPILDSLEFVYRHLKADSQLGANDKKLMFAIRSLFQLDPARPDTLEVFENLKWKIFRLSSA